MQHQSIKFLITESDHELTTALRDLPHCWYSKLLASHIASPLEDLLVLMDSFGKDLL